MSIEIEFISSEVLSNRKSDEKIEYILDRVKKNKILVVEESMSALEESKLIEATMSQIKGKFFGIEISTLKNKGLEGIRHRLIRALGGTTGGLTVIGPSKMIRKVKKQPQSISLLAGEQ
ncbi:MAG: DUF2073 domain-containing protein [Candidatus Altiarchaeales archaeon]|nr:DUF2073 domain-containing protein [Candidatus Altiarchaeota archaeon]MBU4266875.1 DUF2073 domain-containing protein [Candidatus Altiarchaeota archaeon]MBU4406811.1 DUF2073 domain-containing protein [Candidatus Altiarchaeota archaeon]MCG2782350.1 DUF2073 domain-containing protein [Candidatus Altiarchaeales archaeon]